MSVRPISSNLNVPFKKDRHLKSISEGGFSGFPRRKSSVIPMNRISKVSASENVHSGKRFIRLPYWLIALLLILIAIAFWSLIAANLVLILQCPGGKCSCNANQYFDSGRCLDKKGYNETCNGKISSCADLLCINSICTCSNDSYWDGAKCTVKSLINGNCTSDYSCRTDLGLHCLNMACACDTSIQFWNGTSCVNYYSYRDKCLSDNECKDILICNSLMNNCQCPDPASINQCDCPNSIASEYYWNGSVCLARSSFGFACSSDYMCRSLSESTVCLGSTCRCAALKYFSIKTLKCENQLLVNEYCYNSLNCRADLGLFCQNYACSCNNTAQFWNETKCVNYLTYTESCNTDAECDGSLICNTALSNCSCPNRLMSNQCDCLNTIGNEYYWNGFDCASRGNFGANCTFDYMCRFASQGTTCLPSGATKTCLCQSVEYFDTSLSRCMRRSTINEPCSYTGQCRQDLQLFCLNSSCKCDNETAFWSGATCVNYCNSTQYFNFSTSSCTSRGNINKTCSSSVQCLQNLGLLCSYSLCQCDTFTQYWSGSRCADKQVVNTVCQSACPCRGYLLCTNGTCACPRQLNFEMYWNGTDCTNALSIGSSCINALSSEMCQMLTQGTICNGSGFNYTCQCPPGRLFSSTSNKCQ